MAGFNFADAAAKGYRFTWDERHALIHYAFWPALLKVVTFIIITLMGLEKNLLRQGLILLPAYFLEGWLVAVAVRFAIFGERRPEPLNPDAGDGSPEAAARRRCIMAGMLAYLLIKLATSLCGGLMVNAAMIETPPDTPPAPMEAYVVVIAMFVMAIWAFRLLWLHIPLILDYPVLRFLNRIQGFIASLNMLGVWIVCMIPALAVITGFSQLLMGIFPGPSEEIPSLPHSVILAALQAVVETIVAVLSNVAMAYGLREVLSRDSRK